MTSLSTLELSSIAFFGRPLAEYASFLSLDPNLLRGRSVLDVAAGPSSFTAEAVRRGIDAVAVDPMYGCPAETLAMYVQLDYARIFAQLRAKPGLVRRRGGYASPEAAEAVRREAAERFLRDYESGFPHGRYVGARLPHLPFLDRQFDVVICAHFLCVYADRLDFGFHVAACRELARVSREEVRIHPLCGLDGRPYRELGRLRAALAESGIQSVVTRARGAVFRGARTTMVLRRGG